MDTLPLPPRPSLEQYGKRAKALVEAARSSDTDAVPAWANDWLMALARRLEMPMTPFLRAAIDQAIGALVRQIRRRQHSSGGAEFTLADAHFLIANAHGFASWADFGRHIAEHNASNGNRTPFEAAADAIISGDIVALTALLREHPRLVHERSARVHRATLLHYVSANGVEDFRQRTPANAVDIARLLLEAGSKVDALAETYGGGSDQTTMNLLVSSTHPAEAGLQSPLVELLLDFGAAINGLENDSSPLLTAISFGYPDAAETLVRRGARLDSIIAAAALGRAELVRSLLDAEGRLAPSASRRAPRWLELPDDAAILSLALLAACRYGQADVVDVLLAAGVDPASPDRDGMTALHHAAGRPDLGVVQRLLEHRPPLEATNVWGGTVLDSTVWFAMHASRPRDAWLPVIDALLAAGADASAISPFPTGDRAIDDLVRRRTGRAR